MLVDDEYVSRHFGTERAQYTREKALNLLKGGYVDASSIRIRNVKSDLRQPGESLIAVKFQCLSSERGILHNVYVVFENKNGGEYVPTPCSYCGCENGAFFCSHMLCLLFFLRLVQTTTLSQSEYEEILPEDPKITQSSITLIANIIAMDKLKRQKAQSKRQSKKRREKGQL